MRPNIKFSAHTQKGSNHDYNRDYYHDPAGQDVMRYGHLFVVCDGLYGLEQDVLAAELAATTLHNFYYGVSDSDRSQVLLQSVKHANRVLFDQAQGMLETSCVTALVYQDSLFVTNVGDTRAYLIRGHSIRQLTEDHTGIAEMIRRGDLTPDEAYYGVIDVRKLSRGVGAEADVVVDIFYQSAQSGDHILLCTDGVYGLVSDKEMLHVVRHSSTIETAINQIMELVDLKGCPANATILLISLD